MIISTPFCLLILSKFYGSTTPGYYDVFLSIAPPTTMGACELYLCGRNLTNSYRFTGSLWLCNRTLWLLTRFFDFICDLLTSGYENIWEVIWLAIYKVASRHVILIPNIPYLWGFPFYGFCGCNQRRMSW